MVHPPDWKTLETLTHGVYEELVTKQEKATASANRESRIYTPTEKAGYTPNTENDDKAFKKQTTKSTKLQRTTSKY